MGLVGEMVLVMRLLLGDVVAHVWKWRLGV